MNTKDLYELYKKLWVMSFHHKYRIPDLENMPVFEFDIFIDMTAEHIKKQQEET